ncbi:unnamed protein product, partial [Allacma fusca]
YVGQGYYCFPRSNIGLSRSREDTFSQNFPKDESINFKGS